MESSGLRGLGGAGFPAGRKWRIVRNEAGPRLMAVNIDEGEPGTFKDRVYLETDPHRFLEGMLIAAWAVGIEDIYIYLRDEYHACRTLLQQELRHAAWPTRRCDGHAAHPPAPRRRRLHLRRGVGDDRVHRRQARHAAAAPALRGPGRPVRPAHAGAQLRDPVLGARHPAERPGVVRLARPPWPQGPALVLGLGPRQGTRREAGAGRHHHPGADRRILRRHAGRPRRSTPTCPAAPPAASCRRR